MSDFLRAVFLISFVALVVACSSPPPAPPTPPAPPITDTLGPRVLGAVSTDSNTLVVSFSKEVKGGSDSAEFAGHYSIVSSNVITPISTGVKPASDRVVRPLSLGVVVKAVLSADKKSVTLTTLDQAAIEYTLKVVNVKDLQGNPVVPPDRNNPFQVKFTGKDPTGVKKDTDGDGVEDFFEQLGWDVVVFAIDGTKSTTTVTSDPFNKDTDGDGLSDLGEISNQLDPRSSDTDGDRLLDIDELNVWLTDAAKGDTDGDKLSDGNEVEQFKTNPREADTDGDALSDFDEVGQGKTNARNADLPRVNIAVGTVGLQIDYRFDETINNQTTLGTTKSTAQTTLQAQQTTATQENSSSYDWFVKAGVEVCVSGACEGGGSDVTKQWGAKFTAEAGGGGSYSFRSTTASEQTAQQEYAKTLVDDTQVQQGKTVTRQLVGAKMLLNATLTNLSPWSFDVIDLEIRAERRDPNDRTKLIPVATFRPLPSTVVSLSPISFKTQVMALETDNPIPSVVEGLMSDSENLIFTVSQYKLNVKDRAVIYTEQEVFKRSAFLEIDYQGRQGRSLEQYRPATYFGFNADQSLKGITMKQVMEEILGMKHVVATPSGKGCTEATPSDQLENSYSTCVIDNVQALWRVHTVARITGAPESWYVLTPNGLITPLPESKPPFAGSDFNSLVVLPGQDLAFRFVVDKDRDGLEAGEEARLGSDDTKLDSDGDGISDTDEVRGPKDPISEKRTPWVVDFDDGRPSIKVASNPGRADTDGDGLSDCQELLPKTNGDNPDACALVYYRYDANGVPIVSLIESPLSLLLPNRTNPGDRDTDADGVPDQKEVVGLKSLAFGADVTQAKVDTTRLPRPAPNFTAINPLSRDTDSDTLPDGKEIEIGTNPLVNDGNKVWDDDGDGLVNIVEQAGWKVQYRNVSTTANGDGPLSSSAKISSNPNIADTDGDGLKDNEERTAATNPISADTDADGLTDFAEVKPSTNNFKTFPLDADTDNDKRSDGDEVNTPITYQLFGDTAQTQVFSDPTKADQDKDTLVDGDESFGAFFTDPTKSDTDGDGVSDRVEVKRQTGSIRDRITNPLRADQLLYFFLQARGVPYWNGKICGEIVGGRANFRGLFVATFNNLDIYGLNFDINFGKDFSQDPYPGRFVVITSTTVRVRSEGLVRYDGITPYGLTDFDDTLAPKPDPKTFFDGPFTKTYRQKELNKSDDICSLEVQFVATPITQ